MRHLERLKEDLKDGKRYSILEQGRDKGEGFQLEHWLTWRVEIAARVEKAWRVEIAARVEKAWRVEIAARVHSTRSPDKINVPVGAGTLRK